MLKVAFPSCKLSIEASIGAFKIKHEALVIRTTLLPFCTWFGTDPGKSMHGMSTDSHTTKSTREIENSSISHLL